MEEYQNPHNRYREKASWSGWEINHGVKKENAENPFSQWDSPILYKKWDYARKHYLNHGTTKEESTMKDQLYKYGEQYVKRLATDSKGQAVVEDASTGTIFAVDPTKLELVVPYTVAVQFSSGETTYHYLAVEGTVEKGDILLQAGNVLKIARVTDVNTKSLQATVELKNSFHRKLNTTAF